MVNMNRLDSVKKVQKENKSPAKGLKLKSFAHVGKGTKDSSKTVNRFKLKEGRKETLRGVAAYEGCEVAFKIVSKNVLFEAEPLLNLLYQVLPSALPSSNAKVKQELIKPTTWKSGYVSWSHIKPKVHSQLYPKSLRYMLSNYYPLETFGTVVKSSDQNSLKRDHIKVFGMELAFILVKGSVFFEILGSFTILGELGIAMQCKWKEVDSLLEESGLTQKESFKKRNQNSWTGRSHISVQALLTLLDRGYVKNKLRQVSVAKLFHHLANEISKFEQKKADLVNYLDSVTFEQKTAEKQEKSSMVFSNCCDQKHSVKINGVDVQFLLAQNRIFLAYRQILRLMELKSEIVERVLKISGFSMVSNFLFSKSEEKSHISLEATKMLFQESYGQSKRDIMDKAVQDINQMLESCRSNALPPKIKTEIQDSSEVFKLKMRESIHACSFGSFLSFPKVVEISSQYDPFAESELKCLSRFKCNHMSNMIKTEAFVSALNSGILQNPYNIEICQTLSRDSRSGKRNIRYRKKKILKNMTSSDLKRHLEPCLPILGYAVPYKVENSLAFLEEKPLNRFLIAGNVASGIFKLVKTLQDEPDTLVLGSKKKCFVSTQALIQLVHLGHLQKSLMCPLKEIENSIVALQRCHKLKLGSFGLINIVKSADNLYLHTTQVMSAIGLPNSYLVDGQMKIFDILKKLLKVRGFVINNCFLKKGKFKYAFIALNAFCSLFTSKFGPFRDVKKIMAVKAELRKAVGEMDFHSVDLFSKAVGIESSCNIEIGPNLENIDMKIHQGQLYLHRKSCFRGCGLEKEIVCSDRGFAPVNEILIKNGHELESAYLPEISDEYAYISAEALIDLMECQDPLLNCLEEKDHFTFCLWSFLLNKMSQNKEKFTGKHFKIPEIDGTVPIRIVNDQLFLSRTHVFNLSGLTEKASRSDLGIFDDPVDMMRDRGLDLSLCFREENGDSLAYISIDSLQKLLYWKSEYYLHDKGVRLWNDVLAAIVTEAPKLRIRLRLVHFRKSLVKTILRNVVESMDSNLDQDMDTCLDEPSSVSETKPEVLDLQMLQNAKAEEVDPEESRYLENLFHRGTNRTSSESSVGSQMSDLTSEFELSEFDFQHLFESLRPEGDMIGHWKILAWSPNEIHILLPPGSASSKKISFMNPNVTAVVSYELLLKPGVAPRLTINNSVAPTEIVLDIIEKSIDKGLLNLLLSLHSIRPCFGYYCPELMETLEKTTDNDTWKDCYIDKFFIGSNESGRIHAGTIRARKCKVIAKSTINDSCGECGALKSMSINRSVLKGDTFCNLSKNPDKGKMGLTQESVWKASETGKNGCVFICPQVQSFNTSLPYNFVSHSQATAIIEHKVSLSKKLEPTFLLNGNVIDRKFKEFQEKKQVRPMLEWMASMRMCIGFPELSLVKQTRFLLENIQHARPEVRKHFNNIYVDESFKFRMNSFGSEEISGTVRTSTCRWVANDHTDVCEQCMLLEQPLDFLCPRSKRKRTL